MKTVMKLCGLALAALLIGQNASADYMRTKRKGKADLVSVKVNNNIRTVGRIYVKVKSDSHKTKLVRIWGITRYKKLLFAGTGVNTICAYETNKDPKTRFVYKLELAADGSDHRVKLTEDALEYTYKAQDGLVKTISVESTQEKSVGGKWQPKAE